MRLQDIYSKNEDRFYFSCYILKETPFWAHHIYTTSKSVSQYTQYFTSTWMINHSLCMNYKQYARTTCISQNYSAASYPYCMHTAWVILYNSKSHRQIVLCSPSESIHMSVISQRCSDISHWTYCLTCKTRNLKSPHNCFQITSEYVRNFSITS